MCNVELECIHLIVLVELTSLILSIAAVAVVHNQVLYVKPQNVNKSGDNCLCNSVCASK